MQFNIYGQLKQELQDFFQNKILLADADAESRVRELAQDDSAYYFSQWETLNTIELYYNSQFVNGKYDSEGMEKVFLNICKFRSDVAAKQVDIDTKNFVFLPEDDHSVWGAYFMGKRFKQWAKEQDFGQVINDITQDYVKYGTAVLKKVGNTVERVPLLTLRNQQDASDFQTASYVIEEHKDMTMAEIQEMDAWDIDGMDMRMNETVTVYERYGYVPLTFYKEYKEMEVEEEDHGEVIDVMAILTLNENKEEKKEPTGEILFMEKIKQRPYEEVKWSKQDGRWLGVGEVENQFENQVFRNMVENMRRRGLMWSSKKIFQSADTELAKNLVKDIRDGEILKVMPNGLVSQVNMNTQNLGEFAQAIDSWDRNSDQKSFTFEVATGEALPSGTPFRLGVLLSSAANSHFGLKRENLGLFFKRVVSNLLVPVFKKQNRSEHTMALFADEEGVETLKQALIKIHTNNQIKEVLLSAQIPNAEEIRVNVEEQVNARKELFVKFPQGFYDGIKHSVDLVITGESVDVPKKIETLTNLFNVLAQRQDPRADVVLEKIIALTGENMEALAGVKPQQQIPQQQQLQQLLPQQQPAEQAL